MFKNNTLQGLTMCHLGVYAREYWCPWGKEAVGIIHIINYVFMSPTKSEGGREELWNTYPATAKDQKFLYMSY